MPPKNTKDSTVYYKNDGEMQPLEIVDCPDFASLSENLSDFCTKLGEAIISTVRPLVDALREIFDNFEPYQSYELLHPRKKPRGSIRRRKRSRR